MDSVRVKLSVRASVRIRDTTITVKVCDRAGIN